MLTKPPRKSIQAGRYFPRSCVFLFGDEPEFPGETAGGCVCAGCGGGVMFTEGRGAEGAMTWGTTRGAGVGIGCGGAAGVTLAEGVAGAWLAVGAGVAVGWRGTSVRGAGELVGTGEYGVSVRGWLTTGCGGVRGRKSELLDWLGGVVPAAGWVTALFSDRVAPGFSVVPKTLTACTGALVPGDLVAVGAEGAGAAGGAVMWLLMMTVVCAPDVAGGSVV